MDIFSVLTMVGGLALFLYGMQVMGDGLAKVSGGKLERILENLTSNPIKAVLLGDGCDSVVIGDDRYGCRICQFGYYEAEPGSGNYHGCQYRYNRNFLDPQFIRVAGRQYLCKIM